MTLEDMKRCVITVRDGLDADQIMQELNSTGPKSPYMPSRSVKIINEKPDSLYNFDAELTASEAILLRNDPRLIDVRIGSKAENGLILQPEILDTTRIYSRNGTLDSTHYNWGLANCTSATDIFTSTVLANSYQFPYTLDGSNVDIVIQDSGIEVGHPEWQNRLGVSRLQLINWPEAAGLSNQYTQSPNHYRDLHGHGTHCAGIAAGRFYGWAKNSNIYAIKILEDASDVCFGVSASFNLIRNWHLRKNPGRPTVVNMSWGYSGSYANISGGAWRGTPWSGTSMQSQYGMVQGRTIGGVWQFPLRTASVDSDIRACIAAGIILVGAAGNHSHKCEVLGGVDYNNYFNSTSFGAQYYHRGPTPAAEVGVIAVGNVSNAYVSGQEAKIMSSAAGPRIDVYAPGSNIMSAIPVGSSVGAAVGSVPYPTNSSFRSTKVTGTSMAAPQVAGMVSTFLQIRPGATAAELVDILEAAADKNRLFDPTSGVPATDYTNFRCLQGPNRYLKTPFAQAWPLSVTGSGSLGWSS
jgi:subtilisin family serine protease